LVANVQRKAKQAKIGSPYWLDVLTHNVALALAFKTILLEHGYIQMGYNGRSVILIILTSMIISFTSFANARVYNEKSGKYLSGNEIKKLLQGNTISYADKYKTKEYIHPSGTAYLYYEADEEYHNQNWCIIEDDICFDSPGFKLSCPKIKISKDGSIRYDESQSKAFNLKASYSIKITKDDIFNIKQTFDEYGWEIYKKKKCP